MGGPVKELLLKTLNYPWLDPLINPGQGTLKHNACPRQPDAPKKWERE